ncbi:MAG: LPS export ABC transporter periplasmic protein LptC [Rhizobiaceae bacterium]
MTDATFEAVTGADRRMTATIYAREQRHSRRIRMLRRALPVLAVLMLAALGVRYVVNQVVGASIDLDGITIESAKVVIANPRMSGFTAANRPYELEAKRAIQSLVDNNKTDLEEITARLPVGKAEWADVETAGGTLLKGSSKLVLTNPVDIVTTDGMTARFEKGELDLGSGTVLGREGVQITTKDARVIAETVDVKSGGTVMVFERNVKMVIEPGGIQPAAGTATD